MHRNYLIDSIRFLAAFAVMIFHFNEPANDTHNWYHSLVQYGWLGVPVFFVISGYCIAWSAEAVFEPGKFLKRRLFRIFPLFLFSFFILMAVAFCTRLITGVNDVTPLPSGMAEWLLHLSLLNPLFGIRSLGWVYWSLSYELMFYLVVAAGLLISNIYSKLRLSVFFILISLIIFLLFDLHRYNALFFLKYWSAFGLGAGLYYCHRAQNGPESRYTGPAIIIVNTVSVIFFNGYKEGEYLFLALVIITSALLYFHRHIQSAPNFLSRLGDTSYAIYLLHVPVGLFVIGRLRPLLPQEIIAVNISIDAVFALVLAGLAKAAYRYIEAPAIDLGKK